MTRPTNIDAILQILAENGPSSQLAIRSRLPNLTPKKVQKALQNAALDGRCHFKAGVAKTGTSGRQGLWFLGATIEKPERTDAAAPRGRLGWIGRVNSVWQLGGQA